MCEGAGTPRIFGLPTLILVGYLMKDLKLVEQLLTLTFHSYYLSCVHVVSRKDGKVCV